MSPRTAPRSTASTHPRAQPLARRMVWTVWVCGWGSSSSELDSPVLSGWAASRAFLAAVAISSREQRDQTESPSVSAHESLSLVEMAVVRNVWRSTRTAHIYLGYFRAILGVSIFELCGMPNAQIILRRSGLMSHMSGLDGRREKRHQGALAVRSPISHDLHKLMVQEVVAMPVLPHGVPRGHRAGEERRPSHRFPQGSGPHAVPPVDDRPSENHVRPRSSSGDERVERAGGGPRVHVRSRGHGER